MFGQSGNALSAMYVIESWSFESYGFVKLAVYLFILPIHSCCNTYSLVTLWQSHRYLRSLQREGVFLTAKGDDSQVWLFLFFWRLCTLKSYINCVPTGRCESQVSFGAKLTTNLRHSSLWTMTPETDKKPGQRQRPSWRKTKAREPDNSPEERQQTWWLTKTVDTQ